MEAEGVVRYEPLPRWGHISVPLGNKVYMWGGRTEDFSEEQKKKLASSVEVFDCRTEVWVTKTTSGIAPPGLYNSAYALHGSTLYAYGGWDGQKAHNTLHKLNLETFAWSEVKVENPDKAPSEMSGCGLVAYGNSKLVLFGGYGMMGEEEKPSEKNEGETVQESEDKVEGGVGHNKEDEKEKIEPSAAESSGSEQRTAATENGVREKEDKKDGEGTESVEKEGKGKEGEVKGEGVSHENGGTVEAAQQSSSGEPTATTAEVTEVVHEKKKKAVVLKPPVSFDLPLENGDTAAPLLETQAPTSAQNSGVKTNTQDGQTDEFVCVDKGEINDGQKDDSEVVNTTFTIYKRDKSDQKGWTNEVKVFDLETGTWSSQPTSGSVPPPCVDFSFACVDKKKAVVFGGYQPETGITNDTFLLDMDTWVWTKLSGLPEHPPSPYQPTPSLLLYPSARDGHAACVIEGSPHSLMLMSGGWDATDHALDDIWLLDITSGLWSQISGGGEMGCRFWHTTVTSQFSSRMRQLFTFGGCPGAPESHTSGSWPKMANTVIVEIGQFQVTGNAGTEEKWIVVDSMPQNKLGNPMRRLQETVLLMSIRVQKAEELIQGMNKKIEKMATMAVPKPKESRVQPKEPRPQSKETKPQQKEQIPQPTPQSSLLKEVMTEETEEEMKPYWQKSRNEIQMTYEEIGRGRFSVVRVAIYHETRVAARCLLARITSEDGRKLFTNCLEKAAQLRHPNLVSFMGAVLDREPVIITELMPCSLRTVLEKNPLTYYQLADVSLGVTKALEYLHSVKPEPVLHGELTGTNVLLEGETGPRLKAKLADYITAKYFHRMMSFMTPASSVEDVFAVSREHPSQEYKFRRRSRSRSGSPFDMVKPRFSPVRSPGQVARRVSNVSNAPLDAGMLSTKRDVYLFGILLVEMATRTAVLEVSLQYLIESIAWPQVTALVKKCLVHDPELRPDMNYVLNQVLQLASSKP